MSDDPKTTHPADTAPRDGRLIDVLLDGDNEWLTARRSPDGMFRHMCGSPFYSQPIEWKEHRA